MAKTNLTENTLYRLKKCLIKKENSKKVGNAILPDRSLDQLYSV